MPDLVYQDACNAGPANPFRAPPVSPSNTELSCEAPNAGFVSFNSLLGGVVDLGARVASASGRRRVQFRSLHSVGSLLALSFAPACLALCDASPALLRAARSLHDHSRFLMPVGLPSLLVSFGLIAFSVRPCDSRSDSLQLYFVNFGPILAARALTCKSA